jgi:hypothetical protein
VSPERAIERYQAITDQAVGVIDGEAPGDYQVFADAALKAAAGGKRRGRPAKAADPADTEQIGLAL